MSELNSVDTALLEVIAGMKNGKAEGAYNIRKDSGCADRVNTENVVITSKTDKPGIDITFAPGCKDTCHIPVIITESGLRETVYNDFYVGEGADVLIIAGCGIHNCGEDASEHDGIHAFHIGRNARVKYVEKHYGEGDGLGENIMNPTTIAYLEEGAFLQMETSQIAGIDSTRKDGSSPAALPRMRAFRSSAPWWKATRNASVTFSATRSLWAMRRSALFRPLPPTIWMPS